MSAEYFHSKESPAAKTAENCQTLSPSASVICQQFPHQLLKSPLTSGVVNREVTPLISTSKVTLYEDGPELQSSHELQQTTGRVVSPLTVNILLVY